ncbi:6-bladed beta-propeller [Gemmatimonadota bacterium]
MISACIVVILFLGACSSPDDSQGHAFQTFREDGISIAENSGGPLYSGELFQFTHLVTLRGDDSVPESLLSRPGDFSVDDDGHYYVIDSRALKVAVFNSTGGYVRSFGQRGSGPGDFMSMRLQSLRDGIISIFDSPLQRTTRMRTDGTLVEVLKLQSGGRPSGLELIGDGSCFVYGYKRYPQGNITNRSLEITHLAAGSEDTIATIMTGEAAHMAEIHIGYTDGKPMVMQGVLPYIGRHIARFVPENGILVSERSEPILRWYDLAGTLIREIRLGIDPQPVTEEMKRRYAESVTITVATTEPEWIYPEYLGYWDDVVVDDAGYTWLQAVAEAAVRSRPYGTVMHVISPEGEYLGVTELPCRFEGISRGSLLGYVTVEETGERIPSVFRIEPMVRGLKYPD